MWSASRRRARRDLFSGSLDNGLPLPKHITTSDSSVGKPSGSLLPPSESQDGYNKPFPLLKSLMQFHFLKRCYSSLAGKTKPFLCKTAKCCHMLHAGC